MAKWTRESLDPNITPISMKKAYISSLISRSPKTCRLNIPGTHWTLKMFVTSANQETGLLEPLSDWWWRGNPQQLVGSPGPGGSPVVHFWHHRLCFSLAQHRQSGPEAIINWGQWHHVDLLVGGGLLLTQNRALWQLSLSDCHPERPVSAAIVRMTSMGAALNLPCWTFLLVISTCLLISVDCQFQRMPEDSGCAPGTTCVLITECPRLLDILKQVLFRF